MSVAQCQREVDSAELSEWMAYYSLEPWGQDAMDYGTAQLVCLIRNLFAEKGARVLEPADIMPGADGKPKQQTPDQMKAILFGGAKIWNAMQNG